MLLNESRRVARQAVILKDHTRNGLFASATLRFMDRVGNARYGVALPYNYWSFAQWREAFGDIGLSVDHWESSIGLYPIPANWLFGRHLHFIARLIPRR